MRILQVGKFYPPHHGGMESVLQGLSEGLARAGQEVTVLCSSDARSSSEERLNGIRVLRAGTLGNVLSQPICPSLPLRLRRLAAAFDVVHFHSPNPLPETAWLLGGARTPFVTTYHADVTRQALTRRLYWPALRGFLSRAGRIVVATRAHIDSSPVLRPFASRCALIPFGLDPETLALARTPDAELTRRARALREQHGRFALFVGRLVGYKGVACLLEALQRLPGATVAIVGEGPLGPELRAQAGALGQAIEKRAIFVGRLEDKRELLAWYLASELFVLPSITQAEAFGMVLLEAMACGKPVVTTRIPSGVNHVNVEGVTGLVAEPRDAASLAGVLGRLFEDEELRTRLGRAARERVEREFTQERMVQAHLALYREVLGNR